MAGDTAQAAALLSREECERVEAAVRAAEALTQGDIVVAVLPQSATYDRHRAAVAFVAGLLASVVLTAVWPHLVGPSPLWVMAGTSLLVWLLCGLPPVLRLLAPADDAATAVHRAAQAAFMEHGVYRSAGGAGVLILVSVLERRVEIVTEAATAELLGPAVFSAAVDAITQGIKSHAAADGLCAAVQQLGQRMAKVLPGTKEQGNPIPDRVA